MNCNNEEMQLILKDLDEIITDKQLMDPIKRSLEKYMDKIKE
jgi:uncharacterized protein (UPF0147 family)